MLIILYLAVIVLTIIGTWKVFVKAGRPGWAAIIPFYNIYVATEIARLPILWFILAILPVVSIVGQIMICIKVAENFGKSAGFGVGLALLSFVFYPILGLGEAKYQGTAGITTGPTSFGAPPSPPADGPPPPPPTPPSQ